MNVKFVEGISQLPVHSHSLSVHFRCQIMFMQALFNAWCHSASVKQYLSGNLVTRLEFEVQVVEVSHGNKLTMTVKPLRPIFSLQSSRHTQMARHIPLSLPTDPPRKKPGSKAKPARSELFYHFRSKADANRLLQKEKHLSQTRRA
jgi:hypothetical protein